MRPGRGLRRRLGLMRAVARDPDLLWVPPGHFYSPVPSRDDRARASAVAARTRELPGVDLRPEHQLALIEELAGLVADLPLGPERGEHRYGFANPFYSWGDGLTYAGMLLRSRPRRVVEVGCGWSSALLLDIDELRLGGATDITFVEPFPEVLEGLARPGDLDGRLLRTPVQQVPVEVFTALDDGDVLFIDSTHVSKAGSDVNHLVFEVLPALRPGVLVHVHDVLHPFEYPAGWLREGRAWNEAYLLRAFLQFNAAFSVELMSTWVAREHAGWLSEHLPDYLRNPGGSLWLRRTA